MSDTTETTTARPSALYPTDIVTDDGWERIHRGHGLDRDALRADLDHNQGVARGGWDLVVQEVHLAYQPRVKWCGRRGEPCDNEGDWHAHWHEVRSGDDATKFTLARYRRASS